MGRMSRVFAFACLALMLTACDGEMPVEDAGTDAGSLPPIEVGDPTGHPEPLGATPSEARAGRLTEAQLPEDPTGLAVWAAGDFVLANDRVALLIEDAGESDLYDPYGGRPVGMAAVRDGALVDAGDLNEILVGFGANPVATEQVTVLNDGSDGGTAVIRASGPLGTFEFAGSLVTDLVAGADYEGVPAAMDYELAPGSNTVEIYMTLEEPAASTLLVAFFQRYRMPYWHPSDGFIAPSGDVPMAAFVHDSGMSYAWVPPGTRPNLRTVIELSGVLVFSNGRVGISADSPERMHLGSLVLGGPGLGGLQAALATETLRTVTGTVTHADGSPAPEARVHVRLADGTHFSRVRPAADGTFSVDVPAAEVSFFAHRLGTALVGPVSVADGVSTVDLVLPATATIRVDVTDTGTGEAIPARVQIMPVGGAPDVPADLGERSLSSGRSHIEFSASGAVEVEVDPGMHDVIVSRGYEFELFTERVTVAAAGDVAMVAADLDRVVDTTGVMCADYHIHTHRSPDSPDSPELKLLALISDGLEIAIRSDHEWVNDFAPVIEGMGLSSLAYGIGGEELTTFAWGHFGVFPLTEDRTQRSGSAISWVGRLPPAVFADVRARAEAPVLIINHPRSGAALGGYFNAAGFDNLTGMVARADHWDEDFSLVEVFNDKSFEQERDGTVADWFALLNSGREVFAVGSSDSHNVDSSPVGYPRTCLAVGVDDTASLTDELVRDTTAVGASTISGGIYLDVVGPGGAAPGDHVTSAGTAASFDVTVQAASWIMGTMQLEVIVDGVTVETIPIGDPPDVLNPVLRLDATGISVPVAAGGSWVVFHVSSDGTLAPVHPGRIPFAVSNPVFLTP